MRSKKQNISSEETQEHVPFFSNRTDHSSFFTKPVVQRKCDECGEEEEVQKKADTNETTTTKGISPPGENEGSDNDISNALSSKAGKGQPIPAGSRSKMESAFGTDFGEVTLHDDGESAALSDRLDAQAFTYGQDIYFNQGRFNPGTTEGDGLLAHELAHTVQQRSATGTEDSSDDIMLEKDADQATISMLGMERSGGKNVQTKKRSGLRLSRCSKGPMDASRRTKAVASFRSNNSGLGTAELDKIERAIAITGSGNINLEITFFEKYASNSITKDTSVVGNELAFTDPSGNMRINPSVFASTYSDASLGNLLVHELVHTKHGTNWMGANDYLEGEAYATEYFFAERTGDTVRTAAIITIISSGSLTIPFQRPALLAIFKRTYASLKIIYQVIDTGTTPHPSSPLAGVTAAHARELSTELVTVKEADRGAELTGIVSWAEANQATIGIPPV